MKPTWCFLDWIANAAQALRSVNIANYYDNSGEGPRLILAAAGAVVGS